VIRAPDQRVVATTDLLVEGRHFRRDWSGAFDIGGKAAAQNLADVAAMGAAPTALLVGLAAPGDLAVSWAQDLVRGLGEECRRAGAVVAGGDVSSADSVILAITALGDLAGRDPVTRSGARPGDRVAVAGRLGRSAAGLALFQAGLSEPAELARRVREAGAPASALTEVLGLVVSHRRPQPAYDAGPEAAALGATSMIDVSDGLIADLRHVADASGVRINVETAALPQDAGLRLAGRLVDADSLTWALTGGEDHALAATFPPETVLPDRWLVIGAVADGEGVTVDSAAANGTGGWQHFA
jgi:thiamine-monophosphate kinase